eukprot:2770561-Amphidinium_carterae.1
MQTLTCVSLPGCVQVLSATNSASCCWVAPGLFQKLGVCISDLICVIVKGLQYHSTNSVSARIRSYAKYFRNNSQMKRSCDETLFSLQVGLNPLECKWSWIVPPVVGHTPPIEEPQTGASV